MHHNAGHSTVCTVEFETDPYYLKLRQHMTSDYLLIYDFSPALVLKPLQKISLQSLKKMRPFFSFKCQFWGGSQPRKLPI